MCKENLMIGKRKRLREEIFIRWSTPRDGWVKIITNGAAKGNPGRAGCGGMIRVIEEKLLRLLLLIVVYVRVQRLGY